MFSNKRTAFLQQLFRIEWQYIVKKKKFHIAIRHNITEYDKSAELLQLYFPASF